MPGIDRRTDAKDVDPDAPRAEGVMATVGPGAILADALARRECALAYRATVDAMLAMAAPEAGASASPTTAVVPWRSGQMWRRIVQAATRGRLALRPGLAGQ